METALKGISNPGLPRPFVLTVAGLDPTAGAGILSDIKTFEQLRVYGLAVNTANTMQTDQRFSAITWSDTDFLLRSIEMLAARFEVTAVKIGILPSLDVLASVVEQLKSVWPSAALVWDPVIKSTTGHRFLRPMENRAYWAGVFTNLTLITPNFQEVEPLAEAIGYPSKNGSPEQAAAYIATYCSVYLKGGHHPSRPGEDILFSGKNVIKLLPAIERPDDKHGSGCVLCAALTAQLALGYLLPDACKIAKRYTEKFLLSNSTLLGTHVA